MFYIRKRFLSFLAHNLVMHVERAMCGFVYSEPYSRNVTSINKRISQSNRIQCKEKIEASY